MFKHLIKFSGILLLLFLVACGGGAETAVQEQPEQMQEAEPELTEATEGAVETSAEVLPVAAKPQLVEFYADW